jgi:hypothetical protein
MFIFCLGQTKVLKVIVKTTCPHTNLTALMDISLKDIKLIIYWQNLVIMVLPHRELAYLADKENGDNERKRNYGKGVKIILLHLKLGS